MEGQVSGEATRITCLNYATITLQKHLHYDVDRQKQQAVNDVTGVNCYAFALHYECFTVMPSWCSTIQVSCTYVDEVIMAWPK